ncbi:hypothetical protein [Shinella sp.]|uniref:hypothetical protein n=1 Tax=Shinella sp. TaxID=1870904 RepID=UPI0028AD562E|nr:hypothetical protein [Shinella sp.]
MDEDLTDADMHVLKSWAGRIFRGFCYFLVAFMLLTVSQYGLQESRWSLAIVVGILGGGSSSAKIGLCAIALLLLMAVVTPQVLAVIHH